VTASGHGIRLTDASIRLDAMPVAGRELAVSPSAEERESIAAQLNLTSVDRLEVKLHAVKFRGGIRVTGRLEAAITQPSVVSLEPVTQEIAESIDRIFLPGPEKPFAEAANAEIFVDLEGDDVPDHFDGPEADLSELIVETLALAVDLYPRAPGESLDDLGLEPDVVEDHPFSALKGLKPRGS
jgi:uncharacterized metal-binding protein YceD (DUF177 family)